MNIDADCKEALLRAAQNGDEAVARWLLDANPDARDRFGMTALTFAASAGYELVVRLLLQRGDFNPDARIKDGSTPLICSAWYGHEVVIRLLLDHGADENAKNEAGQTALWCASRNGHDRVVRLLLEQDDIDQNSNDRYGRTPLMIATQKGHREIVQLLLDRGKIKADIRSDPSFPERPSGAGLEVKDRNGKLEEEADSHLRTAENKRNEAAKDLLVLKRVDPNRRLHSGSTQSVEEEGSLKSIMSRPQLNKSAKFIQTTNERMFDKVKHKIAYDFLSELDNKVAGGQIASKTAWGGGVQITWSKKLKTTAGQASWKREKITIPVTGTNCQSVSYQFKASIELSEKLIDNEDRLLNTVAHEFCHLACFIISYTREKHGKIFEEWGNKCNQAFGHRGVIVTTKHSYGACGVKIKRQRKDFLALLPIELSVIIIKYLDAKSLCRAAQVSTRWRKIINADDLTWKRRFDNDGFVLAEGELERAIRAVSNPFIGLPSPMFKSLYRRHCLIRRDWMDGDIKPRHIAFCAHRNKAIPCLQFDTEKILVGYDKNACIEVYDIKTGALRKRLRGHEGSVWALEFHGNTLVSCSTDHSVRVWDIEKGVCTQVLEGHTDTVRCLKILMPVRVGMMPDGQAEMVPKVPLIITGSRDSTLRVWKLPLSGDKPFFPTGPSQNKSECPYFFRILEGHHGPVRAIAAHEDTLVSGSYDNTVRVWKMSTGETKHCLRGHTQKVFSVVLDHKRNICISGSMDNTVKVWSLDTGGLVRNLEGYTNLIGLLDLSHDLLVSAAADSTLRIWNPENGQCVSTLIGHTGVISCFQHDDQKVISGSNQSLKVWNVQNGEFAKDLLTDLTKVLLTTLLSKIYV